MHSRRYYIYIYIHARYDTRTLNHFQGHKRHRGWTGNFYSLWQRGVVCTKKYAARRCGLRQHNVAAGPPPAPMSPKRCSDNWSGWSTQLFSTQRRPVGNSSRSFSVSRSVGCCRQAIPFSQGFRAHRWGGKWVQSLPTDFCLLARTYRLCYADQGEVNIGESIEKVLYFYLPLSYAAQIPTTRNPALANVHVSLSKLDQEVRKCSVWVSVCVCVCVCVCLLSVSKCVWRKCVVCFCVHMRMRG